MIDIFLSRLNPRLILGGMIICLSYVSVLSAQDKSADTSAGRTALSVEVVPAIRGTLSEFVFADGNAHSIRREFLVFESGGRVDFLKSNADGGPLREGDSVKAGELLAELDRRIDDASVRGARADLDTTRAALANAKQELKRAKQLRASGSIPTRQLDTTEAAHGQALAAMRGAEARLDQVTAGSRQLQIRAPFDGVVAFVNIREGQYVSPGQFETSSDAAAVHTAPIVVIDPRAFEIVIEIPVINGRRVKPDQFAYILDEATLAHVQQVGFGSDRTVDRFEDLFASARVGSVSPAIDPGSRAIRARVVTDQESVTLSDGGYVTVWIEVARRDDTVIVPMEAVVYRNETAYAFVFDPELNRVEQRTLELGIAGFEGMEVLSGLRSGEVVVTKGRFRLTSGMKVRPTDPAEGDKR